MFIARQGDVLLVKVEANEVPEGLIENKRDKIGRIVLAYGEHSGHSHAIRDRNVTSLRLSTTQEDPSGVSGMVDYIYVGGSGAALHHEYESGTMAEHHPISLDEGYYRVVLQREYSPEGIRRAQD